MQPRIPLMMVVMAFGVGCSELPPRERQGPPDDIRAEREASGGGQGRAPVTTGEDGVGAEEDAARYD